MIAKRALTLALATVGGLVLAPPALAEAADSLPGAKLYQARCATCHSLDANRIGPAHRGVLGRAAGSAPGYSYSPALKASGIIWNAANLDQWLQGPQKLVKGSKMYLVVPGASDREAIITYLRAASGK
ncbi:cytochrome c family protein [Novosphingobium sp. NDB2Meth1]|uniref:c-type cytochrome n=1 Tax=Novosphingobium sp. NDB2Meth1 TaxID=1892847 RepID=UPI0009310A9C|nr:c-type cytochrome [Novosphingobium sp. NDB2Meth1]